MEQLKAFLEKAESDKELMDKFNEIGSNGACADDYIALASEYGFTVTMEEMEEEKKSVLLSEDQLEDVAGGIAPRLFCWFSTAGETKEIDGNNYRLCNAWWCSTKWETCKCKDTPQCKDSWHRLNHREWGLYPKDWANHSKKLPPEYKT